MVKRALWLSVTPEPERELPKIIATLVCGEPPPAWAVVREQARVQRLVLRGSQRRWLDYLHEVVDLIQRTEGPAGLEHARARSRGAAVIANHHHQLLALPGPAAARTAVDRDLAQRLVDDAQPRADPQPARGGP